MNANFKEVWPIALLLAALALVFFTKTEGPFIVDEFMYANIARDILHLKFAGVSQYAPLYPALTSFAYLDWWPQHRFDIIQYLNMLFFFAGAVGAFLLARLYLNKTESTLFSVLVLLHPWGAVKLMNWAEPLFYSLFIWFWWAVLSHEKQPSPLRSMLVVILGAALFLTKQAGIVAILSAGLAFAVVIFRQPSSSAKQLLPYAYIAVLIGLLLLFNKFLSGTSLGYQERVTSFMAMPFLEKYFWIALAHNFSYLVHASLIFFPAVVIATLFHYRSLPPENRLLIISAVLFSALILIVTAMHRATLPGLEENPFGRYLAPAQILLIFTGLVVAKQAKTLWLVGAGALLLFVVAMVPVLHATTGYGAVNNFDLAVWEKIFNFPREWGKAREVSSQSVMVSISILAGLFFLLLISRKHQKGLFLVALVLFAYSGLCAQANLLGVAKGLEALNKVAAWTAAKVENDSVFLAPELWRSSQARGVISFWIDPGKKLQPADPTMVLFPMIFDFGHKDSTIPAGSIRVSAPFHPSGAYTPEQGYGFDNLFNIDARRWAGQTEGGGLDYIFGWEDRTFRIDLPPGKYKISMHGKAMENLAEKNTFSVISGSKEHFEVQGESYQFSKHVYADDSGLVLKFSAKPKSIWYVSDLVVEQDKTCLKRQKGYLITAKTSRLKGAYPVYESGNMLVFSIAPPRCDN